MFKFGQKWLFSVNWLYSVISGCIRAKVVYSGKSGCTPESGCILAKWLYSGKLAVFGQKRLYSSKTGFIRTKWKCSGKSGCIRARWLYSGKLVVFGEKWLYTGKGGCIRAKVVVLRKVVVFFQSGCIRVN